jgi:galactonate dehydratase
MVRVDSQNGLVGWGECGAAMAAGEVAAARQALVGLSASSYEVAWRRLEAAPVLRAGIDMALLDIAAQQSKAPVYQLLGGPTRTKCRAFVPLEGAAALERNLQAGHKAFGVTAPPNEWRNAGKPYVEKAANLMQMMRRAAGAGTDFVLDGGGRLMPGDAQSVAAALEKFHLLCFDEPVTVSNLGAAKKIAGENVTPLGFGRSVTSVGTFQDLLREDCVDLVRPSLARFGVSQVRRIAAVAEVYYVAVAPYHDGGPLGTLAALHLAASMPNFFIQQIPSPASARDREMRKGILSEDVERVTNGFAALPNAPGWGVRINESALGRAI